MGRLVRMTVPPLAALLALAAAGRAEPRASRTLDDYRHFRALAVDLLGRAPRRGELAAFERSDFQWDAWIDRLLAGPGYVDRLVRVYMDLLRLEVGPAFTYAPAAVTLRRQLIKGPHGEDLPEVRNWVWPAATAAAGTAPQLSAEDPS